MEAQGNVRILRRVVCRDRKVNLIKTNLMNALATNLFITDGFHSQVAFGQAIHIVGHVRFEHVRLEQSIKCNTLECDAIVGKNMNVVLEILSNL